MKWVGKAIVTIIVLLILYVGGYYLNVEPYRYLPETDDGPILKPEAKDFRYKPRYLFGGEVAEKAFLPMSEIDKMIRPKSWTEPSN